MRFEARWHGTWLGVGAGAALCLLAGAAWAETPDEGLRVALDQAIAELDSNDYTVRQGATDALTSDRSVTDEQIAQALTRQDLSAEQRSRLVGVLHERFMKSPRGAMGIQYMQNIKPPRIAAVFPDFPAARAGLLKVGDEIVSIEGRPLDDDLEVMRQETFSRDPGDVLRIRVRRTERVGEDGKPIEAPPQQQRQGLNLNPNAQPFLQPGDPGTVTKELDLELELGSTASFPNASSLTGIVLENAFTMRLANLGVSPAPPRTIEPKAPDAAWGSGMFRVPSAAERWNRLLMGPNEDELTDGANYGRVAVARQNQRLIAQLNALRRGGNANNLPDALNVRVDVANVAGGGQVQIARVEVPKELAEQNAARMQQIQEQLAAQLRAQRLAAEAAGAGDDDVPAPAPGPTVSAEAVQAANRIAARLGALEAKIGEQTRMLRGSAGDDPNVRRMAQESIDDLRAQVATLRQRLEDAMNGRLDEPMRDASIDE